MKLWKFGRILETGTDSWLRSVDQERLPFAWNFRVRFWGQMEQINFSGKNGSKYDAVPLVKNAPVELGRLGWLVPRLTKSSTKLGEIMAQVRFLQMVQLILVISVETKKRNTFEGIPSIPEKFHRVDEPFHLTFHPKKMVFRYKWYCQPPRCIDLA